MAPTFPSWHYTYMHYICSAVWFVQRVLVVTFHDLCLPQLLSRPARELMFLLNLLEYMVVLFGCHVLISRNVSVSVLYPSLRLASPMLVERVSGRPQTLCMLFANFRTRHVSVHHASLSMSLRIFKTVSNLRRFLDWMCHLYVTHTFLREI